MHTHGKFRLEPLEPRVLLSGDSIAVAIGYQTLLNSGADDAGNPATVVVESVNSDAASETTSTGRSDETDVVSGAKVSVAWSESWLASSLANAENSPESAPAIEAESEVLPSVVSDSSDSRGAQFERVETNVAEQQKAEVEGSSANGGSNGDDQIHPVFSVVQLPRGPPGGDQSSSALVAQELINNNTLNPADSPLGDEGGLFVVLEATFSEPTGDAMPRAPPVSGALLTDEPDYLRSEPGLAATAQNPIPSLTEQALAPVLEHAIRMWIAGGSDGSLAERLASLEFRIVDLPVGILGQADGQLILIDADADGFGWFVDPTPGESSEFKVTLNDTQLIADAGSDAFGRIDLLTVLVHEIGHVAGFDHESDLAVMDADLSVGRRIQFAETGGVGSTRVTGALTLDPGAFLNGSSDAGPITFRIFDDIANLGDDPGVLDVEVTGADSGNLIYNDVSSLIGSLLSFTDQIVVDVDAYVKWNLSGLNAGTVTVAGFATISFTQVENLTGALTANDAFIVGDLGGVTGTIDDRGGSTGVDVGNGALVAVVPDTFITWTNSTGDVLTGNSNLGTAGMIASASVRKITFSGANLFVGSGAALNATGDGIITTNAIGFAASGASLSMASVTTAAEGVPGVQASV